MPIKQFLSINIQGLTQLLKIYLKHKKFKGFSFFHILMICNQEEDEDDVDLNLVTDAYIEDRSGRIWIGNNMDQEEYGAGRIWTRKNMDQEESGSGRIWTRKNMDQKEYGTGRIWIRNDKDQENDGLRR